MSGWIRFRKRRRSPPGKNLTNEVFGFYNGSPSLPVQREYYKPTIGAGLRWTSTPEKI